MRPVKYVADTGSINHTFTHPSNHAAITYVHNDDVPISLFLRIDVSPSLTTKMVTRVNHEDTSSPMLRNGTLVVTDAITSLITTLLNLSSIPDSSDLVITGHISNLGRSVALA